MVATSCWYGNVVSMNWSAGFGQPDADGTWPTTLTLLLSGKPPR